MKLKIGMNIAGVQRDNIHGYHKKDMIVLHETVSANYVGWNDIISVSEYLDNKDYGIYGITDADGHIAAALGLGTAIFYHTASSGEKGNGNINSRAIGIEQVSRVMLDYHTNKARLAAWLRMENELRATAKLCAALCRAHSIPIVASDGSVPGITTHWLVTKTFGVSGGHVDCWPVNNNGYYPLGRVIALTKRYHLLGMKF